MKLAIAGPVKAVFALMAPVLAGAVGVDMDLLLRGENPSIDLVEHMYIYLFDRQSSQ